MQEVTPLRAELRTEGISLLPARTPARALAHLDLRSGRLPLGTVHSPAGPRAGRRRPLDLGLSPETEGRRLQEGLGRAVQGGRTRARGLLVRGRSPCRARGRGAVSVRVSGTDTGKRPSGDDPGVVAQRKGPKAGAPTATFSF